jgi:hemoglobin
MALLVAGMVAVGCRDDKKEGMNAGGDSGMKKSASGKSLYERLGGESVISSVVDEFVARAATDTTNVNFTRKGQPREWDTSAANVARLKKRLVQFIGMATGGPQKYEGLSMPEAHRNMKITESEFNAAAGHLKAALDKFKVPAREQDELLRIVSTTKQDIVGK